MGGTLNVNKLYEGSNIVHWLEKCATQVGNEGDIICRVHPLLATWETRIMINSIKSFVNKNSDSIVIIVYIYIYFLFPLLYLLMHD